MATPITIITGYLGSGKTTLLRHILDNADRKIAVVMNEFGSIDIDSKIIKGSNVDIAELKGGCVCCSISGELEPAVKELIGRAKPEHIVVEATGVVDPESLICDIQENMPFLKLDGVVCVVDCDAMNRYPEIGPTAEIQIRMADVILLNKVDLIDDAMQVESRVRKINSRAIVHKTVGCSISPDLLFGSYTDKRARRNIHSDIGDVKSFVFRTDKIAKRPEMENFLQSLERVRAKGFVNFPNGTYMFNCVNGRLDFEKWKKEKTVMVFIGNVMDIESRLKKLF